MTKFLQRIQLVLWAAAIVVAIVYQFTGHGELSEVPDVALYIFNLVGVVLLLGSGYLVLAQRKHRVLRLVGVNLTILCTEALYFMMTPNATTMMYCFLLALLLSLVAYPIEKSAPAKPQEQPAENLDAEEENLDAEKEFVDAEKEILDAE